MSKASPLAPRRPADAGPPLPAVAGVSAALFVAGLVVPAALSGEAYPAPGGGIDALQSYVSSHSDALRLGSLFHLASSIPLAVFTAAAVARLHALGVRAAGPLIALAGGVLASAALALSASARWALAESGSASSTPVIRVVNDVSYVTGGPWHVMALGLLIAGVAVASAFHRLLPRALWVPGVALAVICELAVLALISDAAAYLLPVGRFGGLVWLIAAGAMLPRSRTKRSLSEPPEDGSSRWRAGAER